MNTDKMNTDKMGENTPTAIMLCLVTLFYLLGLSITASIVCSIILGFFVILNHMDSDIPYINGVIKTEENE